MIKHGRSAYIRHVCECDYCKEDSRLYAKKRRDGDGIPRQRIVRIHKYSMSDVLLIMGTEKNEVVAEKIGVTTAAIYQVRKRMMMPSPPSKQDERKFTEEEEAILRERITNRECGEKLGRTTKEVMGARSYRKITDYPRTKAGAYPGRKKKTVETPAASTTPSRPVWRPTGFTPTPEA